jgi:hypothetical protein
MHEFVTVHVKNEIEKGNWVIQEVPKTLKKKLPQGVNQNQYDKLLENNS